MAALKAQADKAEQEKLKAEQEAAMQKAMEDAKRAAEEQARSLVTTPSSSRPRSG